MRTTAVILLIATALFATSPGAEENSAPRPRWEQLFEESLSMYDYFEPGRWQRILKDLREEVMKIPEDDPRFVEASCLLVLRHQGGHAEKFADRALSRLKRSGPKQPLKRFRSLDLAAWMTTELNAGLDKRGRLVSQASNLDRSQSADECRRADEAFLRLAKIRMYISSVAGLPSNALPPNRKDGFRAAAGEFVSLYKDVERKLGRKHPYLATLLELGVGYCDKRAQKRHPRACPSRAKAYLRALRLRKKAFGHNHPLTRASLLRTAAFQLEIRKTSPAVKNLEIACRHPLTDRSGVLAAALLAVQRDQRGKREAAKKLLERATRAAGQVADLGQWNRTMVFQLQATLFRASKEYRKAIRALEQARDLSGEGKKQGSREIFELCLLAKDEKLAIAELSRLLNDKEDSLGRAVDEGSRRMFIQELLPLLKKRHDLLEKNGRLLEAKRDELEIKKLEKADLSPVKPLSLEQIRATVHSHRVDLWECLSMGSNDTKDFARGRAVALITVKADGSVQDVRISDSTLDKPGVEECIVKTIRGWNFPEAGTLTVVNYPVVFRP